MMRRRGERTLSADEVSLWSQVVRTVRALPGRTMPSPAPLDTPSDRAPSAEDPALTPGPMHPPPGTPALKPLTPLERRMLTALKRGTKPLEGVLDLHGMRQDEAHARLRAFLMRSQAQGASLVLVITGKGAAGTADGPGLCAERGVLRRMVPHWLRMADLRGVVMGFEEASQRHGGAGALYVRLRRDRETPRGVRSR